jgi:ribosomal protein S4E
MRSKTPGKLKDGEQCKVIGGTHAGKSGTVRDVNTSKTGYVTIIRFAAMLAGRLVVIKYRHSQNVDVGGN